MTKYNYQDKVEFKFNDSNKVGYIEIIDRFGTFEQQDEPSYDIMSYEDACLYKHVPESFIVCKMEDDGLLRGNLYLEDSTFKVGHKRTGKVDLTSEYTQIRIVGWLDWTSMDDVNLADWVGYRVEVK